MKKQLLLITLLFTLGFGSKAQTILGVDVSHYDSDPPYGAENWSQVNSTGKKFAWNKATQGISYTDPSFANNMVNGTAAGVVMGAYHFATPESNTAVAEANWFVSVAGAYIKAGYLPPVLDLEDPSGGTALTSYFSSSTLTTWVQTWMTTVQNATGVAPIIYTSGSIAGYLNSSLNVYGLWSADPDGSATLAPNAAHLGVWTTWMFKQYSWTGVVAGIGSLSSSAVDLDVFNGDTTAFNKLIGISGNVTAAFTSNIQTGCPGMSVTFTDQSVASGNITGYKWTFSGGSPASDTSKNPVITYNTPGSYAVKEVVTSSTGADSITKTAYINVIQTSALPLQETFQSSTFPPTGWTMHFQNAGDSAWELCKALGNNSTQCMYFPANCGYVHNIAGEHQQIYTPDYSFVGTTNPKMWFDVAYEPYDRKFSDTLAIYYSLDCGNSWTNIYFKGGMTLTTTGSTDSAGVDTSGGNGCFIPPNSNAWRTDTIGLAALVGDPSVMFSFESRSGWGNIMYIDNINVASVSTTCTPPAATITAGGPTTFCQGGSVVLTASPASTYKWSNNATTQSITVTQSGNYSVVAGNGANCSATSTATTVTVNPSPTATISAGGATTFCQGGSVTLTASAGNSYLWSNNATTQSINVTQGGSYTVVVSNASNCSATSTSTVVTVNPLPTATITAGGATTFCQGGSVTLTASTGGSYLWSNSATTQSINVTQGGSYTVVVSNASNCSATSTATAVTVNPLPVATITAGGATTFCQGGSVILTASSGTGYLWSNSTTTQGITVTQAGSYTVVVSNASNCSATSTATTVTVNPLPTVSVSASSAQVCKGQSVTLTAAGNGSSYQWSGTGLQGTTGTSVNAVLNTAGSQTYTVTATLNGCTATASTSVNFSNSVVPTISISQTTANPVCTGSQVSFSASSTNGGNNPVYQWTSGSQSGTGSAFTLTNASNGATVQCLLISNSSCAVPDSVTSNILTVATQIPQPVSISISTPDTNVCSGDNVTFTSAPLNAGNNPSYNWYVNNSPSGSSASYTLTNVQSASSVYCVVTASGGCITGSPATSNVIGIHIQNSVQTSVSISADNTIVCAGALVTFTATPVNGGNSPLYVWKLNGNAVGSNSAVYTSSTLQNGDAVSCQLTSSSTCVLTPTVTSNAVTIHVNPLPIADAGNSGHITSSSSVTIGGNPSASGGTSPYNYLWSPSTGLSSTSSANPVVSGIGSNTNYTLQVTDSKGCTASDTVGVYFTSCTMQTPTVQLNFCDLAAQYLASANYRWYLQGVVIPGATTRFYTATQTGYYYVLVSDLAGCTAQSPDIYVSYPACITTGVESLLNNAEFEIYPNPVAGELEVSISNSGTGTGHIEIYNVYGQIVYQGGNIDISSGNKYNINTGNLAAGSYFIRLINGENRFSVKRFIKM